MTTLRSKRVGGRSTSSGRPTASGTRSSRWTGPASTGGAATGRRRDGRLSRVEQHPVFLRGPVVPDSLEEGENPPARLRPDDDPVGAEAARVGLHVRRAWLVELRRDVSVTLPEEERPVQRSR